MISNFIWEHKWKFFSFIAVLGFIVLVAFFRSDDTWKAFAKWLVKKRKQLLKQRVDKEKKKIRKNEKQVDNIDKRIEKIKEKEKKIEKTNKNKDLDELAEEIKNMGY